MNSLSDLFVEGRPINSLSDLFVDRRPINSLSDLFVDRSAFPINSLSDSSVAMAKPWPIQAFSEAGSIIAQIFRNVSWKN